MAVKRTTKKPPAKKRVSAAKSAKKKAPATQPERPPSRKIVFLAANSSFSHTNFAAWYLRAYTANLGWQWRTVDLVVGEEPYPAFNRIADAQPDVLAVTFYAFNSDCLLSILRRYKAAFPSCVVIAGGPEFLGDNREFLTRERCIDFAIRGEGEVPFREFLCHFDTRDHWPKIRGYCGFASDEYVDNGVAEAVDDLDKIPSPFARLATGHFRKPFIQMETSRGCFNKCSFCASGATEGARYFSDERIIADLELIRRAGIRHVRMVDRTFNDKSARAAKLIKSFRDDFKELNFHLEIDPCKITQEILDALEPARAGQFHMDVGVQSFNQQVMDNCGRAGSTQKTVAGLKALCKLKSVEVHADLIAGLPGSTLNQTLADLVKLVSFKPSEIQLELLKLLPGTALQAERNKWGIASSPEPLYEVLRTDKMTTNDMLAAHWLCRMVDWFYEPDCLRPVMQKASDSMENFWLVLSEFYRTRHGHWMKPSLVNRFKLLREFFEGRDGKLLHALQYAWLKHGMSPDEIICRAESWKRPIPDYAEFVEGNKGASVLQASVVKLDRTYIFAYSSQRNMGAVAVYTIPDSVVM